MLPKLRSASVCVSTEKSFCVPAQSLVRGSSPARIACALSIFTPTRGIGAEVPQSDRVTGGGDVGLIDRLVGLGLNRNADGGVMGQHAVDGLDEISVERLLSLDSRT